MMRCVAITASPVAGGNGDKLVSEALAGAAASGAECVRFDLRDLDIHPCRACMACKTTGKCAVDDDFQEVLEGIREADAVLVSLPIYFNLPDAQSVTFLNRMFSIFGPETPTNPASKRLALLVTMGGSDPEAMKRLVGDAAAFFPQVSERRIETFPNLSDGPDACVGNEEYLGRAKAAGEWVCRA